MVISVINFKKTDFSSVEKEIEKPVLRERYCHGSLVEAQIRN